MNLFAKLKKKWDMAKWEMKIQIIAAQESSLAQYPFLIWMEFTGRGICEKEGYKAAQEAALKWLHEFAEKPFIRFTNAEELTKEYDEIDDKWNAEHPLVSYKELKTGDLVFYANKDTGVRQAATYMGSGWAQLDAGAYVRAKSYNRRNKGEKDIFTGDYSREYADPSSVERLHPPSITIGPLF